MPISKYYDEIQPDEYLVDPDTGLPMSWSKNMNPNAQWNPDPTASPEGPMANDGMYVGSIGAEQRPNLQVPDRRMPEIPMPRGNTQLPDRRMPELAMPRESTQVPDRMMPELPGSPELPTSQPAIPQNIMNAKRASDVPGSEWLAFLGSMGKSAPQSLMGKRASSSSPELMDTLYKQSRGEEDLARTEPQRNMGNRIAMDKAISQGQMDDAALGKARSDAAFNAKLQDPNSQESLFVTGAMKQSGIPIPDGMSASAFLKLQPSIKPLFDQLSTNAKNKFSSSERLGEEKFKASESALERASREKLKGMDTNKPSGQITPYQNYQITKNERDNYQKQIKDMNEIVTQFTSLEPLVNSGKAFDKYAMIYMFNKMLDPGSVVRESEFANTRAGAGLMGQLGGYAARLNNEGVIDTASAKKMLETARILKDAAKQGIAKKAAMARESAQSFGANPDLVAPAPIQQENQEIQSDYVGPNDDVPKRGGR